MNKFVKILSLTLFLASIDISVVSHSEASQAIINRQLSQDNPIKKSEIELMIEAESIILRGNKTDYSQALSKLKQALTICESKGCNSVTHFIILKKVVILYRKLGNNIQAMEHFILAQEVQCKATDDCSKLTEDYKNKLREIGQSEQASNHFFTKVSIYTSLRTKFDNAEDSFDLAATLKRKGKLKQAGASQL
jgi:tetratricopeptide (TPR) repeat protein